MDWAPCHLQSVCVEEKEKQYLLVKDFCKMTVRDMDSGWLQVCAGDLCNKCDQAFLRLTLMNSLFMLRTGHSFSAVRGYKRVGQQLREETSASSIKETPGKKAEK